MTGTALSLYVHLPWCIRKCPYCDFNSHPSVGGMDEDAYVRALLRDLRFDLEQQPEFLHDREISSIFFGGGTPSLFSARAIGNILDASSQALRFARDIEITLEANPGASEQSRFTGYRAAGVNRLSIGIQSFNEAQLQTLGRIHGRDEALAAATAARAAGFENINLDLMYALPQQNLAEAASDLQQAIHLEPAHISYYQLTMEPGTYFHKHPPELPESEHAWDMQLQGETMLHKAGYTQYEVSAYAQPDRQCRHNLNYWQFGDYLGIGAGAHAKLSNALAQRIIRSSKQRMPLKYMSQAGSADCLTEHADILLNDRSFEYLLNALRLKQGFKTSDFSLRTGLSEAALMQKLDRARSQGLLEIASSRVCTTPKGWRHIDSILTSALD